MIVAIPIPIPIPELVAKVNTLSIGPLLTSNQVAEQLTQLLTDEPEKEKTILKSQGAAAHSRYLKKRAYAVFWRWQEYRIQMIGLEARKYIDGQDFLTYSPRIKKDKYLSFDIWLLVVRMRLLHTYSYVSVNQATKMVDAPYSPNVLATHYRQVSAWLSGSPILDLIDHRLHCIRQTADEMLPLRAIIKRHHKDEATIWRKYMLVLHARNMRDRRATQ